MYNILSHRKIKENGTKTSKKKCLMEFCVILLCFKKVLSRENPIKCC